MLGLPTTSVLLGNQDTGDDLRSGLRLGLGRWLDVDGTLGIDLGFLYLAGQEDSFFASSPAVPILARPFTDATTNMAASQLVAYPGSILGNIAAAADSGNLFGFHVDVKEVALARPGCRLEALVGYRFLHVDDSLTVRENLVSLDGTLGVVPGTHITNGDRFEARNTFHGVDLGVRGEIAGERWSAQLLGKVAVGTMQRQVEISGDQLVTVPGGGSASAAAGFLALSSNSGSFRSDEWTAIPEAGVTLAWHVSDNIRLSVGYSVLFLPNVARAADQVDLTINPNLLPPAVPGASPSRPSFEFRESELLVQSVNFGVALRY